MTATVFVDTNVLVYAADRSEPVKQRRAQDWMALLWRSGTGRISTQVLHEYYTTVTRKLTPPLPRDQVREDIDDLQSWTPLAPGRGEMQLAWSIEDRFGLSWWDSLIVAAAQASRCDILLTEDLQHGQRFDGLEVVDPFAVAPGDES